MMLEAAAPFTKDYQLVLAGAPGMDPASVSYTHLDTVVTFNIQLVDIYIQLL